MELDLVKLSKTCSYLLRHGAKKEGLTISDDGFVNVNDFIQMLSTKYNFSVTFQDLDILVKQDTKGRFEFGENNSTIRATQGHSKKLGIDSESILTRYIPPQFVIHGTFSKNIPGILKNGLQSKSRTHIHCVEELGQKSGFRPDCDTLVYINTHLAVNDGIKFYKSNNGVVLTSGINNKLDPKYLSIKYLVDSKWVNWGP